METGKYRYVKNGSEYSIQREFENDFTGMIEWQHMFYAGSLEEAKKEVKMCRDAFKTFPQGKHANY